MGDRRIPSQRVNDAENVSTWWRHHDNLLSHWPYAITWTIGWSDQSGSFTHILQLFYWHLIMAEQRQYPNWCCCRISALHWRHNERYGVSKHRRVHGLLECWFRRRSQKTSKLRTTGLCAGKSPVTGEFPAQNASNAENISIWWRHHQRDSKSRNSDLTTLRPRGILHYGHHVATGLTLRSPPARRSEGIETGGPHRSLDKG